MKSQIEERWLWPHEAAQRLRISRATINRWRKSGIIVGKLQPTGWWKYAESEVARVEAAMNQANVSSAREL